MATLTPAHQACVAFLQANQKPIGDQLDAAGAPHIIATIVPSTGTMHFVSNLPDGPRKADLLRIMANIILQNADAQPKLELPAGLRSMLHA